MKKMKKMKKTSIGISDIMEAFTNEEYMDFPCSLIINELFYIEEDSSVSLKHGDMTLQEFKAIWRKKYKEAKQFQKYEKIELKDFLKAYKMILNLFKKLD